MRTLEQWERDWQASEQRHREHPTEARWRRLRQLNDEHVAIRRRLPPEHRLHLARSEGEE